MYEYEIYISSDWSDEEGLFIKEWGKGWVRIDYAGKDGDSRLKHGCFWPSVKSALC